MEQAPAASAAAPSTAQDTSSPSPDVSHETLPGEQAEPSIDAPDQEPEQTPEPQVFKKKINGKWVEVSSDELWKHYGLEQTARERLQEAARIRKEAEEMQASTASERDQLAQFLYELKKRPETAFELLSEMGHDAKKIAKQMVLREMEWERMTPEQKELEELRQYKQQQDQLLERQKEEEETQRLTQAERQAVEQVDALISEAVKLSGLQPKPKTVARLAEACQTLINANPNGDLPSAEQVLKRFRSYMNQDAKELYQAQDVDKLIELGLLDDNSIKRIADYHLRKSKEKLPSFSASRPAQADRETKQSKKIGVSDFFKNL
jgi:Asp-tRNA(Asn)/Glu-tRNA(Gln) amidotransferase A subunit family amidase